MFLAGTAWLFPATLWMWDLTPPGYVVMVLLFSALFGLAGLVTPPDGRRRLALPGAIVLAELIRWSVPFGGVPIAHLAMSQVETPVAQIARLGGSLAVVAAVVVVGQSLTALASSQRRAGLIGLAVILGLVGLAYVVPRSDVRTTFDVALVQGGGPQRTRASSSQEPVVLARHIEATRHIGEPVDLVVWPENVINPGRLLDRQDAYNQVSALASDLDAPILGGWFYRVSDTNTVNYHSTITPDGDEIDRYDKITLVPFGEYVPFRSVIELINDEIPSRDVIPGTRDQVLDTPVGPVGVSISWEGFFEKRARAATRQGAEVLTNPTNGSSYWLTQLQTQQVASNQLRAIENDRWVLQVSPTGFSAIVTPDGDVEQRTSISERKVLTSTVEMRTGTTIATRLGFWPLALLGLLAVIAAQILSIRRT